MTYRYGVIIADPPWHYNQSWVQGNCAQHYDTLNDDDIRALDVASVAADDAVLFLWATWPKLDVAFSVMTTWGFAYVSGLPWVKVTHLESDLFGAAPMKPVYGTGFWVRGCSEPILIGRKGDVSASRSGHVGLISESFSHSRKPDSLYDLAETFSGPYLEMFARRTRAHWDSLGNEIDGMDIRAALWNMRIANAHRQAVSGHG